MERHSSMAQIIGDIEVEQISEYQNTTADPRIKQIESITEAISITLMAVGILGNMLVLWTVLRSPSLHAPMYITVASLAVADGLTLIFAPSSVLLWHHKSDNIFTCYTMEFLARSFLLASSLHIVLISYERFIAVRYPLHARSILTNRRTLNTISVIYVASLLLNIYVIFMFRYANDSCNMKPSNWQLHYDLVLYSIRGLVPVMVLVILNINVAIVLIDRAKQKHQMTGHTGMAGHSKNTKERNRALLMMSLVVVAYTVLTTPVIVFHIYVVLLLDIGKKLPDLSTYNMHICYSIGRVLMNTNAAINPAIYAAMSRSFRELMEEAILCRKVSPDKEEANLSMRRTSTSTEHSVNQGRQPSDMSPQSYAGEQSRYSCTSVPSHVHDRECTPSRQLSRTEFWNAIRSNLSNVSTANTVNTPLHYRVSSICAQNERSRVSMENIPTHVRRQSSHDSSSKQRSHTQTVLLHKAAQRSSAHGWKDSSAKQSSPMKPVSLRSAIKYRRTKSWQESSKKRNTPTQSISLRTVTPRTSAHVFNDSTPKQSPVKQNVSFQLTDHRSSTESTGTRV